MNKRTLLLATAQIIAIFASLFASASVAPPGEWEEIHRDELVTVYKKEIEGSDILAVKGVGTLDAPFAKVLSVVLDAPHRPQWMEQVEGVEVVRQISPTECIAYWHLSPPWPIRDRDLLIRETIEVDSANKRITLRMKSIEDPAFPPRADRIRAELFDASFVATPVDGGTKTAMIAESHADPKGSIPKWVVNIYQKDMPTKSIRRMLARANQADIAEHPLARELQ